MLGLAKLNIGYFDFLRDYFSIGQGICASLKKGSKA